ncbi:MAG: excalibur calcium-binding domain-containing protein [Oceanospirillaceae bacterium]
MKKIVLIVLIGAAVWQIYIRQVSDQQNVPVITNADLELMNTPYFDISNSTKSAQLSSSSPSNSQKYSCDGRQHCSQMGSCAEAEFFLQNRPYTKMDGDNDGIPCERQFCN